MDRKAVWKRGNRGYAEKAQTEKTETQIDRSGGIALIRGRPLRGRVAALEVFANGRGR